MAIETMGKKLPQKYESRAQIIKAISHPSRLFIIEELHKSPRSVGELTNMIGADASTVSKHLSILKNEGLVYDERKGTSILYHLKCPCILNFISCIEDVLESRVQSEMEALQSCRIR